MRRKYIKIPTFHIHNISPTPTGATAPSGPGPPHYPGFTITLRHTHTHSVRLPWKRYRAVAETST